MKTFSGFECGMGLGGWLTNYKRVRLLPTDKRLMITTGDLEHFRDYIGADDVQRIAALGVDHIRVGFDQAAIEHYDAPGTYREQVLQYLDRFMEDCRSAGLRVLLNLHKAVGMYVDSPEDHDALLVQSDLRERFVQLWLMLERRYARQDHVAFELLNEVMPTEGDLWNTLADETITKLRELNPTRILMVGSTNANSPRRLAELRTYDDPNVVYTFHFYDPHDFTHQRGLLMKHHLYNRQMPFPGPIGIYRESRQVIGEPDDDLAGLDEMGVEYLQRMLQPAIDFAAANPDKILYCGEFGTIRHARMEWREAWLGGVIRILRDNEIPYCVWNYLSTPYDGNKFSLFDDETREILSPKLRDIILYGGRSA